MQKIILSLIAILISATSLVSATENTTYSSIENSVISVDYYQLYDKSTFIVLSNGMEVYYKDQDLFVDNGWKVGDRVLLDHARNRFYLQNTSFRGRVPVTIAGGSREQIEPYPTVHRLNTIHNIKKNEVRKTLRLTLDDGTEWHVGAWSTAWTEDWEIGDNVIALAYPFSVGKATHWILNMDRRAAKQPVAIRARLRTKATLPDVQDENARPIRLDNPTAITKVVDIGKMLQHMPKNSHSQKNVQINQQMNIPSYMVELEGGQLLFGVTQSKSRDSWKVGEKVVIDFTHIQPQLINLRTLDTMQIYNTQAAPLFAQDLKIVRIASNSKAELSNGVVVRLRRLANNRFAVGDSVHYSPSPLNPNVGILSHADNPTLPGVTVSIVR